MCQFFESIRVLDGEVFAIAAHQERIDRTLTLKQGLPFSLFKIAKEFNFPIQGLYKWRVQYNLEGLYTSECTAYEIQKPTGFKLVTADHIVYDCKYQDRKQIHALTESVRPSDIIMLKDGLVTDSSYANLVFYNGTQWLSPRTPLLLGTQRNELLNNGLLHLADIRPQDLPALPFFKLINALMPFESSPLLSTNKYIIKKQ